MKKLAFAALAAAVLCGCSDSGADKVKMITEATFPPYEFLRGHEIVGIDVEICRAIAQKLGREFSCETVDFDSVIPAVISGKADLAISDFITSEEYAIAIKKGQPELLKAINETIAEIKADGRLAKWIADYTAEADKLKDK